MKDLSLGGNTDRELCTLGQICSELRSSIIGGFARDSAILNLTDICEFYGVDGDMAQAVIDTLVSEQYLSHHNGTPVYKIKYNAEELRISTKRRRSLEGGALKACLTKQNTSLCNQQYKYKELLCVYQSGNNISTAAIAYICSLFQSLSRIKFDEIEIVLCTYKKYLHLYCADLSNMSAYLQNLNHFNDSCIKLYLTSAEEYLDQALSNVERYVVNILDDRETSVFRRYDQPAIVGTIGPGRWIIRRKDV